MREAINQGVGLAPESHSFGRGGAQSRHFAACPLVLAILAAGWLGPVVAQTAGTGGGGLGGAGVSGGGHAGQGGGIIGGDGGTGGAAVPGATSPFGGGAGGGAVPVPGGIQGQPGSSGGPQGGQGGIPGPPGPLVPINGGGGGGGGMQGSGGGGGGGVTDGTVPGSSNGASGATVATVITTSGSYVPGGSITGTVGGSTVVGVGGAGGGAVGILSTGGAAIDVQSGIAITGGAGGSADGPPAPVIGGSGGGGAGVAMSSGSIAVSGVVTGGAGGASAGNSGGGGAGVVITAGSVQVNPGGQILGGAGGVAGVGYSTGLGGAAVSIGAGTVVNFGTLRGGAGAMANFSGQTGGQAVLAGSNVTVVNRGTLEGGQHLGQTTRQAVLFQGSGNRLELWEGSVTTGDVIFAGSGNTLAVGSASGSPTSITIDGSLQLGSGSLFEVRANSTGQADQVYATNVANVGGTVKVLASPGAWAENTRYTIVRAGQSVTGGFSAVTSNFAFLMPSLVQGATDIELVMQRQTSGGRPISFADAADTANQKAVAGAIDYLPPNNEVYRTVLNLETGAPPAAFAALSGDMHATSRSALQADALTVRTAPLKHLRANLVAAMAPGAPTAQLGGSDTTASAAALPYSTALPAWAEIIGNWQRFDGDGNAPGGRQSTGGVFVGADRSVGAGWRLGAALGYTSGTFMVDDRSSKSGIDSYSALLYGGKAFEVGIDHLNWLLGAAYTWHDISSERRVSLPGLDQTLRADYGASTSQFFTELGYAMRFTGVTLEPFAGVAWSDLRTRGFSETGGAAALSGRSARDTQTITTLGLRAQAPVSLGRLDGAVRGALGWRHAFGDVQPVSEMAFDGGRVFTVAGVAIARDAALVELGMDMAISRSATLGISYSGQFASNTRENAGTASLRWAF